jgi:hypothetical protein
MTGAGLEQKLTAARDEHMVPGRELHVQEMRGYRFCEVGLVTGAGHDEAIANVWNTTGTCDPTPEQVEALDADTIARDNVAVRAWLNPLRRWMVDRIDVMEAGADRSFGGITGTWIGAADATVGGSYEPGYIYRNSMLTFSAGNHVYLLDAPDGEVFIMQSMTDGDDLAHLGSRLDLPSGWGFRAELLDEDLAVTSNPDNLVHVLQDNLHNVYQGSDAGRAFSRFCREYERW